MKLFWIVGGIVATILLIVLITFFPFTSVKAGHRGVVTRFGAVQETILSEGFHVISPLDDVHEINVQTQKMEADADSASKDLQTVNVRVAVNAHVDPTNVQRLYQEVSGNVWETVVAPAIQESVKAATAGFTAEELITKRAEVSGMIDVVLTERLSKKYLVVENVSIVNFSFSETFTEAIEAKVTAEQDALASKNKLEQTKYEAEQKIVSATAEAQAIKIQAEAITQQGGDAYVELQAVKQWNGILPTQMLGSAMPFINVTK